MKLQKKLSIYLTLILIIISDSSGQISLERKKITKKISMEIPVDFVPMSEAELYTKYVSARKPIAMYTSPDHQVDLGVNENSSPWTGTDLELLKDFYKANIANLFTNVDFIQEDIREIGGRQFVIFEFVSKITDEESVFGNSSAISKYTYLQYTIRDNNVLLFNFTCPARLRARWQEAAKEMMESVRLKE